MPCFRRNRANWYCRHSSQRRQSSLHPHHRKENLVARLVCTDDNVEGSQIQRDQQLAAEVEVVRRVVLVADEGRPSTATLTLRT